VLFNIACGRGRMRKKGHTGVCLNANPAGYGSAYGYVDMGGWIGGQAEYVMVPAPTGTCSSSRTRTRRSRRFWT
jgi:threonine dehydrogenase-like Zn-dependent dehydrogenase